MKLSFLVTYILLLPLNLVATDCLREALKKALAEVPVSEEIFLKVPEIGRNINDFTNTHMTWMLQRSESLARSNNEFSNDEAEFFDVVYRSSLEARRKFIEEFSHASDLEHLKLMLGSYSKNRARDYLRKVKGALGGSRNKNGDNTGIDITISGNENFIAKEIHSSSSAGEVIENSHLKTPESSLLIPTSVDDNFAPAIYLTAKEKYIYDKMSKDGQSSRSLAKDLKISESNISITLALIKARVRLFKQMKNLKESFKGEDSLSALIERHREFLEEAEVKVFSELYLEGKSVSEISKRDKTPKVSLYQTIESINSKFKVMLREIIGKSRDTAYHERVHSMEPLEIQKLVKDHINLGKNTNKIDLFSYLTEVRKIETAYKKGHKLQLYINEMFRDKKLSIEEIRAIDLIYHEGFKIPMLAKILNSNTGTIRNLRKDALEKIKENYNGDVVSDLETYFSKVRLQKDVSKIEHLRQKSLQLFEGSNKKKQEEFTSSLSRKKKYLYDEITKKGRSAASLAREGEISTEKMKLPSGTIRNPVRFLKKMKSLEGPFIENNSLSALILKYDVFLEVDEITLFSKFYLAGESINDISKASKTPHFSFYPKLESINSKFKIILRDVFGKSKSAHYRQSISLLPHSEIQRIIKDHLFLKSDKREIDLFSYLTKDKRLKSLHEKGDAIQDLVNAMFRDKKLSLEEFRILDLIYSESLKASSLPELLNSTKVKVQTIRRRALEKINAVYEGDLKSDLKKYFSKIAAET